MLGITIVSHVQEIAEGVKKLVSQVAGSTSITIAGGTDDGNMGTSMEKIMNAFSQNEANEILAFYDLGSAKMNLEMAAEMVDKNIHIYSVPIVEGTYVAASLIPTGERLNEIEKQLLPLKIKEWQLWMDF